jgi:hypothetical protein
MPNGEKSIQAEQVIIQELKYYIISIANWKKLCFGEIYIFSQCKIVGVLYSCLEPANVYLR